MYFEIYSPRKDSFGDGMIRGEIDEREREKKKKEFGRAERKERHTDVYPEKSDYE